MQKMRIVLSTLFLWALPIVSRAHSDPHILENPWDWPPTVRQLHFWAEIFGGAIFIGFALFYVFKALRQKTEKK